MSTSDRQPRTIGFTGVRSLLRHRHPMILVDRVLDYEPGEFLTALVCASGASDWAAGHFPERAVMPGTHIMQAFSQCAIMLHVLSSAPLADDEMTLVISLNARFFKPVVPGDRLMLELKVDRVEDNNFHFSANARVDGQRVAAFRALLVRRKLSELGAPLW